MFSEKKIQLLCSSVLLFWQCFFFCVFFCFSLFSINLSKLRYHRQLDTAFTHRTFFLLPLCVKSSSQTDCMTSHSVYSNSEAYARLCRLFFFDTVYKTFFALSPNLLSLFALHLCLCCKRILFFSHKRQSWPKSYASRNWVAWQRPII